jgi:hypothetical protein
LRGPAPIPGRARRRAELARLADAKDALAADGGVVGIHAIDGMAGIGKTAFAIHAAHRLAPSFPDGQSLESSWLMPGSPAAWLVPEAVVVVFDQVWPVEPRVVEAGADLGQAVEEPGQTRRDGKRAAG